MNTLRVSRVVELMEMECKTCGMYYAVPASFYNSLFDNGGFYHCPAGHGWGWEKGNKQKQVEHDEINKRLQEQMRIATEQAERAAKAEKELKRIKKRTHAGLCTCCNRTFQNLARHMQTKHKHINQPKAN